MSWDERIISQAELSNYLKNPRDSSLGEQVNALFEQQKRTWSMLAEGYAALETVDTKRIEFEDSFVIVQHNPKRVRSTSAAVDKASVDARKCFLCDDALPAQEKGIAYGDFMLLCNPFPVLDRHLSVIHRDHTEQKITGHIETMLALTAALSPDYFVLYNGPRSGASAPDHLHFQACSRALLPIEESARNSDPEAHCAACAEAEQGLEVFTLNDAGRGVVVLRTSNVGELAQWTCAALAELATGSANDEPMLNLICTHDGGRWTLYLFPRSRHRPACFFAEGSARLMVSPGAIDMAGVMVVPERADFNRIGAEEVAAIFREVSFNEDQVNEVTERMCKTMGSEESW